MSTAVRRRRYRSYALSRSATFGPGVVIPLGGWLYLGEPLHWKHFVCFALILGAVVVMFGF